MGNKDEQLGAAAPTNQPVFKRLEENWKTRFGISSHGTDRTSRPCGTISGTIYRNKTNPDGETPEADFADVVRITTGFGVPDATYKIVGWFDTNHRFQARAYVFEQPHTAEGSNGELDIDYDLGDTKKPISDTIVPIDAVEERTGVDFFPMLRDNIENLIEGSEQRDLWGS